MGRFLASIASIAMATAALDAGADQVLYEDDQAALSAGAEIGAYYGHTENANFGVGVVDFRSGQVRPPRVDSYEASLKPVLKGHFKTGDRGTFYSRLSAVMALSRGDGDAAGVTRGGEEDIDAEEILFGWRSGDLFPALGKDAVDFSLGAQSFKMGDGLLVWDGNNDAFEDGAYWLIPREAFKRSAVLRLDTGPVRGDLFYLEADRDHDRAEFAGLNLEYKKKESFALGAAYLNFFDSEDRLFARNGMEVADFRFKLNEIPHLPNVSLSGEYIRQFGGNRGTDIEASGWHLTARYDFKSVPWQPYIRYRYARFSGDDPGTAKQEKYDSLFYGYGEYGDWYQGELVSNLLLPNENQRNHMVHIGAWPREWLRLDAIYYRFDLDNKLFNDTAVTSRRFADEIDLSFEIFLSEKSSFGVLYSVAFPSAAAVQSIGGNDAMQALEVFAILSF